MDSRLISGFLEQFPSELRSPLLIGLIVLFGVSKFYDLFCDMPGEILFYSQLAQIGGDHGHRELAHKALRHGGRPPCNRRTESDARRLPTAAARRPRKP